ncbi:hypothetical protein [Acetobacter conturbans]|uniref:Uncharacterized protein n=1 Tax=Acetobacter conturbans TaxID=1737472 RepID=A0ABX0K2J3_9PROT|nr:hypothetical protein [Acetobacter conturbans]NHN88460.1 hypothetical protein [Acetobacter conturbans]
MADERLDLLFHPHHLACQPDLYGFARYGKGERFLNSNVPDDPFLDVQKGVTLASSRVLIFRSEKYRAHTHPPRNFRGVVQRMLC